MMSLPDGPMQSLLNHARKYSSDEPSGGRASSSASSGKDIDDYEHDENRRPSINYPEGYSLDRRLSEAGVNRRPSAAQILTEDTDSFIIGEVVYVDGVKKGRIQFIGETKFGQGEWAGVFLEEALGKNDGAVGSVRYFQCEPRHGVFARLFRLTREPIEGADDVLSQMRKYGYEIIEAPHHHRRGSIGSSGGGSRRGSMSIDEHHHHHPHHLHHLHPRRGSTDRGSMSPRQPRTPEMRRTSISRASPDTTGCAMHDPNRRGSGVGLSGDRRTSLTVPERRGSGSFIPPLSPRGKRVNPGKSPLASPRASRSNLGMNKPIEKDPDVNKLVSEARRLSMGGSGRRGSEIVDHLADEVRRNFSSGARRPSTDITGGRSSSNPRRTSESSSSSSNGGYTRSPLLNRNSRSEAAHNPSSKFSRKTSASLGLGARRSSSSDNNNNNNFNNNNNNNNILNSNSKYAVGKRRPSSELVATELLSRRQSEAGLRRPSASDVILNERTSNLMVGMPVYVDGTKPGRIAYIGDVHFAQGIMAGIHLDQPQGKNNGSIGGIMYFQCEPKRGIFSKLHRLTVSPLNRNGSSNERIY